ncbi:transmembrane protein 220 isoform X2 [Hyla sarda]|uniref:transmembrane protein 220 isoform X2 n=1 Tax=Hyla sarda TaxID=327740 RepID=UPI0024C2412E|nr:transmembrane protein 220 isoform X2 [Hyla sarda]
MEGRSGATLKWGPGLSPWCQLTLWRACNGLMATFFALAAYVQINDPDAEMWIVIYLIPSALIFLLSINPDITGHVIWRTLSGLHCALCCLGASYLLVSLLVSGNIRGLLHEEEGRELSGLVIIALWMFLCKDSGRASLGGVRLLVASSISVLPFLTWIYIYIHKEMRTSWPQHCKTVI